MSSSSDNQQDGDLAETLQETEEKLRRMASQLRAVAESGRTPIFAAIGVVASNAEAILADLLAAETTEEKLEVKARFEESRIQWTAEMSDLQSSIMDGSESQAPTEAPDASDLVCEFADDAEDDCCRAADECASGGAFSWPAGSGYQMSAGCTAVPLGTTSGQGCAEVSTPPVAQDSSSLQNSTEASAFLRSAAELGSLSGEEARAQLVLCLTDEEEGLLTTLKAAVAKVKEDERFEGVHEDAEKLLEQMQLATGAVVPAALAQEFSDDLTGAEERLKAMVNPMREAQWGGFYAKKAAFAVRKYDLYKRKGKMPHLKVEHPQLLECAEVCVDLAEFLRKEAQNSIMDSVTGLVQQVTPSSGAAQLSD